MKLTPTPPVPRAAAPQADGPPPPASLPPEPSAGTKRLMDFHATAYPSRVNEQLLPERALNSTDFSDIDPLQYRKNHTVKNNNVSSTSNANDPYREPGLEMMSTSHLATHFMLMGQELSKNPTGNTKALMPRGYFTRYIAPPFDERSTYRLDYCQEEPEGFHNAAKLTLENYRNNWTEEEKANIDVSKNIPYMTMPESHCKNRTTMYRYTMMPDAQREDFRTLTQHTNLPDLGTSFAYSAYKDDDPRRKITFDPKIAALKRPKSFLEKTNEDVGYDAKKAKETHEELQRLLAVRRDRMTRRRESSNISQRPEDITENNEKHLIIPGTKGAGYRRAPKDNIDYVFLPRDHFCHGVVTECVTKKSRYIDMEDFANQFKQLESNPDARLAILSALIQNVSTKVLSKQLNDAQALKFFEEMLIAVMDPWSRIRKAAIDSVKNVLNSLSKHVDPLNLPPCSTEVCASDAGQGAAAPFREVRFPSFFDSLSQKYTNSTLWYEQEGLLRLSSALVTFWVKDAELSWKMTNLMGMPSLDVSALPVREAGAELLEEITSRRPECRISVRHELMQKLKTNGAENAAVDIVHSVEGCLIAFAKVCDKLVGSEQVEDEDEVAFLLKLGGHPAASIRLYVAEILRPPSEQLFGLVLEKMTRFANQEDLIEHWAFYEMIVITLNNHLMYYLEHRCISFSRCLAYMEHSEFWSIKEVSLRVIVSLLRGIDSSVFEMRRVATQVLPNFVQFHVRHVGSIYDMCDLYNRLKSSPGQVVLSNTRLCNLFDQHMLPLMWWYLAIYVTVRQSPLSRVEQEALARNLKRKLYINTLEEHPAAARIVFLIMCTYFPDICSKLIFGEMLKVESWDCILQRNGRKYIHFGIDFVRMMSIKGRNIAHLVPVWVNSLKHLMSHEQCIVLTMITDTLFPPRDAHLFSFAYDFTFKAPVMVDGGEDLTLGYNWLHSRYPTAEATPCAHDISSKSNMNENVDGYNEGTILAVKNIFDNLYASPGTEPAVLDKIRNLMELLLSDSRGRSWEETILEAIFARLHRLLPNWRDMSPLQEKVAESDDDWDASDDDNDGCVGTGAAEEKEHACVICKLVLSAVPSYHGKFASDVSILLDHGDIDS